MVARTATQRALILGGGVLIAGLIIAGVTLAGGGHRSNGDLYGSRKHPAVAQLAATPTVRPSVPYGRSSLISSGMSCSLRACSEYTASVSVRATPTADARRSISVIRVAPKRCASAARPRPKPSRRRCTSPARACPQPPSAKRVTRRHRRLLDARFEPPSVAAPNARSATPTSAIPDAARAIGNGAMSKAIAD
jgi:hypothetical protein